MKYYVKIFLISGICRFALDYEICKYLKQQISLFISSEPTWSGYRSNDLYGFQTGAFRDGKFLDFIPAGTKRSELLGSINGK